MPGVFLVRHATPDWQRMDLPYHRPPGPPLIEKGLTESGALGAYLLATGVKRVISSPLERCLRTARIAAEAIGVEVQVDERLIEWQPDESPEQVYQRLWPLVETAWQSAANGAPTALVTHGGPITVMLASFGMDRQTLQQFQCFDHKNPLPPGAVWYAGRADENSPWELALVFIPPNEEL